MTLFSEAECQFSVIVEGEDIPTECFLKACGGITPFIDILGPVVFKLPKADIQGHVQRVMRKYETNPTQFATLQAIVESEIEDNTSTGRRTSTRSILILKRTLEFVYLFLENLLAGEEDLTKCASIAYEGSLKRYHGWIIRGFFHLLIRAIPYRHDLVAACKKDPSVSDEQLYQDARDTIAAMKTNIDEINRFYTEKGQHSDERYNAIEF